MRNKVQAAKQTQPPTPPFLPADTGKAGRFVLQSKPYLKWDSGVSGPIKSATTAKSDDKNTAKQPANTSGVGEN